MKTRALIAVMACFAFLMILVGHAKADTPVNFTVTINTGSEMGDVFTGSYTYNSSNQMTSFTFNDPNWDSTAFTGSTSPAWNGSGQGYAYFQVTDPTNWLVWFNANNQTPDDAFAFGFPSSAHNALAPYLFYYGAPGGAGSGCENAGCFFEDGSGTISFNGIPASLPTPTPEPGTMLLLGTGITGLVGLLRRRQKA
jgi:hypothetical protein